MGKYGINKGGRRNRPGALKRAIAKQEATEANADPVELSQRKQRQERVAAQRTLQKEISSLKQAKSKLKKSAIHYQQRKHITQRLKQLRSEAKNFREV
ncbi:MAG: uncharacterized protein KVP18_004876 [Porospora cf. gigantea A]|uniref:uncharacterized protein n=1 Tax=Porospora cf. gigantea A TaxID=2853593 RepID=UPI003559F1B0|nr:MAG: hypothetical protein KVP18_004876 [Porospora cf. gigantea A]